MEPNIDKVETIPTFETNDLSMAAYLLMRGMQLISARQMGTTYKFQFKSDPTITQLQVSYANSECSRFDDAVRKLKKILFSGKTSRRE